MILCLVVIIMILMGAVFWIFQSHGQEEEASQEGFLNSVYERMNGEEDQGYAISSSREEAVQTGKKILEQGGNAVDAAIAMSYTLGVVEPSSSGIGGGGCMVIFDPRTDEYYYYDYTSEAANSGFSQTIMVPGLVSGMETIREEIGSMDLSELLAPAIKYCDGVEVSKELSIRINNASGVLDTNSPFYEEDHWLTEGETLVQKELKETLMTLASEGASSFYTGTIAKEIANEIGMSLEDLSAYETKRSDVVKDQYLDYEIVSAAAPYSGVTLIQMVKMAERLEMPDSETDNESYLNDLRTITVASHSDRIKNIYDNNSEDLDIPYLVSDEYIDQLLMSSVNDVDYEEDECEDTTAFTVIDKDGMVVACTNTLSSFFGCKEEVAGFYMNNSGKNFGTGVNAYAPGKRPRTHIAPTILRSDDEVMAIASPGGNVIVKVLGSVLIDICQHGEEPQEAVDKQRVLFENSSLIYYEIGYETDSIAKMSGMEYPAVPISNHPYFGCVAISGYKEDDGFFAAKDVRRQGSCIAYNK